MKLAKIISWLDAVLEPGRFDDVSNNGLQIAREGDVIAKVAFGVDASADFISRAVDAGAGLCVVHHGISWGGGIRRLTGGAYEVVRRAIAGNVALYAMHLPLDANRRCGNNWEIARRLGLSGVKPAFSYHGNVIGVAGRAAKTASVAVGPALVSLKRGEKVGVCSGGAGEFAEAAKALGCDLYITGEASWGDVIAAENIGMRMVTLGHYETETFGVAALMREMKKELRVDAELLLRPGFVQA